MGSTCTKLVPVKERGTSKVIFRSNKVQSIPVTEDGPENDDSTDGSLDDRGTQFITQEEEEEVSYESNDVFSKGDHRREENGKCNIEASEEFNLQTHRNISSGDFVSDDSNNKSVNHKNMTAPDEHTPFLQQDGNPGRNDGDTLSNSNSRPPSPANGDNEDVNADKTDIHDFRDMNANRNEAGSCKTQAEKVVQQSDGDYLETGQVGDGNEDERCEDDSGESTTSDKLAHTQDSLFFFPLDDGRQRPVTPHRIPERLLHRARKPPLSYNERMLLADLNRFEQLDKRREFAVRRNRSIFRHGKLPQIPKDKTKDEESPDSNPDNMD